VAAEWFDREVFTRRARFGRLMQLMPSNARPSRSWRWQNPSPRRGKARATRRAKRCLRFGAEGAIVVTSFSRRGCTARCPGDSARRSSCFWRRSYIKFGKVFGYGGSHTHRHDVAKWYDWVAVALHHLALRVRFRGRESHDSERLTKHFRTSGCGGRVGFLLQTRLSFEFSLVCPKVSC